MKPVTYICNYCGKKRTVPAWYFKQLYPDGKGPFACSIQCGCKLRERGNSVIVTCPNCGKQSRRKKSHANRLFCNVDCYGEYRGKHPELYPPNHPGEEAMKRLRDRTGPKNPNYRMTGDKSPHWKGGREKYRGNGWFTIRKLIKRRDENRCAICGRHESEVRQIDIHHIFNWADTHCNHPYNLITLCINCHQGAVHGNSPAPPNHELAALAQESSRARLAPDDYQLIARLDLQQRQSRGLPAHVVEVLGLPESYLDDWRQIHLFQF